LRVFGRTTNTPSGQATEVSSATVYEMASYSSLHTVAQNGENYFTSNYNSIRCEVLPSKYSIYL